MNKKNNSFSIMNFAGSLIVDQVLSVLAAFVVVTILGIIFPNGNFWLNFIICILAYATIFYTDSWHRGFSDANRIRLGILPNNKFRGLLVGLIASVPSFLLAGLAYLAQTGIIAVYDVFENDITLFLNRFWQLPFNSLFFMLNKSPVLNFVLPFFMPIISGFGYFLGVNEFSLRQILVYTKDTKK